QPVGDGHHPGPKPQQDRRVDVQRTSRRMPPRPMAHGVGPARRARDPRALYFISFTPMMTSFLKCSSSLSQTAPPSTSLLSDGSLVPVFSEELPCDAPSWQSS